MMKAHLKFIGTNSARFSNGLHLQLNERLYEIIGRVELAKLHVTEEMMKEWKAGIDLETDINKQSSLSDITRKLRDKDRERDEVLTNIFGLIRSQCYSPIEATREAALKLSAELKPYVGIQKGLFEKETADIRGLERDAAKFPTQVTLLGLTPIINELHRVNEEYSRLFLQRHDDGQASKLPSAREARRLTDDAFESISQCILASYQMSTVEPDRKLIADLVDSLNAMSDKFKASHKESLSQKKSAEKKQPGGGSNKKPDGGSKKPDDDSKIPGGKSGSGKNPDDSSKNPGDDSKKPDDGGTKKPEREEDPGEDQA